MPPQKMMMAMTKVMEEGQETSCAGEVSDSSVVIFWVI
jgi:phosphoribosyl-ATP pyrophosphohydrolase